MDRADAWQSHALAGCVKPPFPLDDNDAAATFTPLRRVLTRVAYRMLGSVSDAEDTVQEAFLRWMATDRAAIREPEAWLRRTVTRLCLDQLKSARYRRETYIGPWLPDPVIEDTDCEPEDVTLPLVLPVLSFPMRHSTVFSSKIILGIE